MRARRRSGPSLTRRFEATVRVVFRTETHRPSVRSRSRSRSFHEGGACAARREVRQFEGQRFLLRLRQRPFVTATLRTTGRHRADDQEATTTNGDRVDDATEIAGEHLHDAGASGSFVKQLGFEKSMAVTVTTSPRVALIPPRTSRFASSQPGRHRSSADRVARQPSWQCDLLITTAIESFRSCSCCASWRSSCC